MHYELIYDYADDWTRYFNLGFAGVLILFAGLLLVLTELRRRRKSRKAAARGRRPAGRNSFQELGRFGISVLLLLLTAAAYNVSRFVWLNSTHNDIAAMTASRSCRIAEGPGAITRLGSRACCFLRIGKLRFKRGSLTLMGDVKPRKVHARATLCRLAGKDRLARYEVRRAASR